jgi:predicted nucleic acid-binding protein
VIVVDSSVWIDFFNGHTTPEVQQLDQLLGTTPIAVGDVILVEVLQGFSTNRDHATAERLFRGLPVLEMLGTANAYSAAALYRQLRQRGITVRRTIDGIIATACINAELPLLFSDRVFLPYVEVFGLQRP